MPDQILQFGIKCIAGQPEETFETLTNEAALQININNHAFTITSAAMEMYIAWVRAFINSGYY